MHSLPTLQISCENSSSSQQEDAQSLLEKELSYNEARALYEEAEQSLLKVQVSMRGFIFSRWLLGHYFALRKQKLGSRWNSWLKTKWPEVSLTTAMLWIGFHERTPFSSIQVTELPTLKGDYIRALHA